MPNDIVTNHIQVDLSWRAVEYEGRMHHLRVALVLGQIE